MVGPTGHPAPSSKDKKKLGAKHWDFMKHHRECTYELLMADIKPTENYVVQPVDCVGGPDSSSLDRSSDWQAALRACCIAALNVHNRSACAVYQAAAQSVPRDLAMHVLLESKGLLVGPCFFNHTQIASLVTPCSGKAETRSTLEPPRGWKAGTRRSLTKASDSGGGDLPARKRDSNAY